MLLFLVLVAVTSGLEVKVGDLSSTNNMHGVSGEVFALGDRTLMVKNFNYDGLGPDAFFLVGTEGTPDNTNEKNTAILAHPVGSAKFYEYRSQEATKLGASFGADVTLTLPPFFKVTEGAIIFTHFLSFFSPCINFHPLQGYPEN